MKAKINAMLLLILIVILPLRIVPTDGDSSHTNIGAFGGFGQYAQISRGCEGQIVDKDKIPFSEFGICIDHKTQSPLRYGIQASYFTFKELTEHWDEEQAYEIKTSSTENIIAAHPYANFEWKHFAFGFGFLFTNHTLLFSGDADEDIAKGMTSIYVRGGSLNKIYVDFSLSHMPPLLSGDNFRMGVGHRYPNFDLWGGIGYGMYDSIGLLFRSKLHLQKNLSLDIYSRFNEAARIYEYTVNMGLTYRFNK
ncbi:hypothetical protein B6I21_07790 [candidate division KSB1 bacterium 4572_119]|nr:MAG: hypothetical protein B6I21_07790 [candidate division KSB1 bacterium 4572_119]